MLLKTTPVIYLVFLFFIFAFSSAQTQVFRENNKWGIKQNDNIIIVPVYDTIFNFDSTGKLCLACYRIKQVTANKYMNIVKTTHLCRYLDKNNNRLVIQIDNKNDTCSVFQLAKNSVELYDNNHSFFTVSAKNKRYLVDKNFKQLTFGPYHNIYLTQDPNFYLAEYKNEGDVVLTGLVDLQEKPIVPFEYSDVKINEKDSLIVACSASVRPNASDDIFDYFGKKTASYKTHVDMATKNFVIHKFYEPKEHYVFRNLKNNEETSLEGEKLEIFGKDSVLIFYKNERYLYDLNSKQKKLYKSK